MMTYQLAGGPAGAVNGDTVADWPAASVTNDVIGTAAGAVVAVCLPTMPYGVPVMRFRNTAKALFHLAVGV